MGGQVVAPWMFPTMYVTERSCARPREGSVSAGYYALGGVNGDLPGWRGRVPIVRECGRQFSLIAEERRRIDQ